jgi:choice-of-anchor A domain-containing protein/uncharacterized repeat protein (TIGR01451 family)
MITAPLRVALRAALACAALLGLAAIPLASSASATPVSCTTTTNPLGAATGFTEFMFGNGQRHSVESEGAVAYGGTLNTGGNMPVGGHLMAEAVPPPTASTPTLIVAGSLTGSVNLAAGSAYVNGHGPSSVNFNGGGSYLASNPIDFNAALTDLQTKSNAWAAATPNGDVQTTVQDGFKGRITFHGTDPQLNVFTIDASQLHPSGAISELRFFYDVPAGAVSIINVTGSSASIKAFEIRMGTPTGSSTQVSDGTKAQMKGILWNFPGATSINIDLGAAWGGSILAPKASITSNASPMIGQFIAKDFDLNRETHINQFPSSACLPGGGGGGGSDNADVQITKSASKANPGGGSTFIYTLTAKNNGPDKAKNVKVSDTLPLGVTFDWASSDCSVAGVIVTCNAGDLNNGESKTFKIGVIANPIGSGGSVPHPGQQHNLTIEKVESQVDLEPGDTKTVQLTCPNAGILSDGSIRVDAVDQGTGALTDVHVLSAQSTGISTWEAVVSNGATGRAQAKAFAVCLPAKTESAGGHQHSLVAAPALVTTTQSWGVGRQTATVACPNGTLPIVPGFAFAGGAATVAGSEPTAGGWKFTVDVTAPTSATLSVRCLDRDVASASGHTHALVTKHLVKTVTIGAGQTVEEQVICADDAKGIVGTWSLPPGVFSLGNDPRPKTRAYKLVNTTGSDQTAIVDLECLNDRTGPEKVAGASPVTVVNTATVSTTSTDAVSGNNSASATVTVAPDKVVALGASAKAGSSKLTVKAIASVSDSATITIKSKTGTVWASGTTSLTAGVAKTVQLDLTSAGQSALGSSTKKGKGLIEISAGSGTRWMTIKPA